MKEKKFTFKGEDFWTDENGNIYRSGVLGPSKAGEMKEDGSFSIITESGKEIGYLSGDGSVCERKIGLIFDTYKKVGKEKG